MILKAVQNYYNLYNRMFKKSTNDPITDPLEDQQDNESAGILGKLPGNIVDTIKNVGVPIGGSLNSFVNKTIQKIVTDDSSRNKNEVIILNGNGYVIDPIQLKIGNMSFTDPYLLGLQTARMACQTAINNSILKDISDINNEQRLLISSLVSSIKNPESAYITNKLVNYFNSDEYLRNPDKGIQDLQVYKQIYNINESKMKPVYDPKTGLYGITDKFGNTKWYDDDRGIYKTPFGEIKTPTMYRGATYMGPLSPNDNFPGEVDPNKYNSTDEYYKNSAAMIDLLSMEHDINYSNGGFFSAKADLIYVAQIENVLENNPEYFGRNQYGVDTKKYAKFGAWWFKNVSPFLSKVVGNTQRSEINNIYSDDRGDFFDSIMADHLPQGIIESSKINNPYILRGSLLVKDQNRKLFYEGLINEINTQFEKCKKDYVQALSTIE